MNDPRVALRAVHRNWLCLRASVRAMRAKLLAAEHAVSGDARRHPGPEMAALQAQVLEERRAIDRLARNLDDRIAVVGRECAALEPIVTATITAAAKR